MDGECNYVLWLWLRLLSVYVYGHVYYQCRREHFCILDGILSLSGRMFRSYFCFLVAVNVAVLNLTANAVFGW